MMTSLRSRLVAALLVLAFFGLVLAGAITYAEQRSFLYDRIDQQAKAAFGPVSHRLDEGGSTVPGGAPPGFGPGRGGPGPGRDLDNLPPGTYGQRRDASDRIVGKPTFLYSTVYGQKAPAAPKIPAHLKPGHFITVGSVGSDLRYRVIALSNVDQPGTTVIAVPLHEVDQTLHRLLLVELLVIAGVLIALAALAWVLVRVGLRPLDRIAETAGAIAGGDLSHRVEPADERTEVGRLGLALNAMLGRLEQAFAERQASEDRLRRFIADASHELRTPLSSIRGYAELFRIGAADNPADVEKSMGRIEDEAARMGVLVEDLLTLARLDEVRAPVREHVDMSGLAEDAVDDARAIAPDRAITLRSESDAIVSGDPHQLRQVLANLTRNVLTHTPAGTAFEVKVTEAPDDSVVVEVRDHGPGLPNGGTDPLFERFWRAEAGRERGKAGAGLGLAIVAAIVHAHHGSVAAANAPGGGAVFTVRLPAFKPADAD